MIFNGKEIDVRSGDIILFRNAFYLWNPMRWLSAAIRFFTGVKYNHCAIVVSDWNVLMLNEARANGVVCRPLANYLRRYKTKIYILRPYSVIESAICIKANSKLGCSYDFASLFLHQVWYRLTGKWIGRTKSAAENSMVCSEYVAWCYNLDLWWLFSAKELLNCSEFYPVFIE